MTLYISKIDYEAKTVTLDTKPPQNQHVNLQPPNYQLDDFLLGGSTLRRGVALCVDCPDGPAYCPWPRE